MPPTQPPQYPPYQPPYQYQYQPQYQQQYPPQVQQQQYGKQSGKQWGKKRSSGYQPGPLGYGSRSGLERPQGPLATDKRYAANWGFEYVIEPGPFGAGYAAYITDVQSGSPAAQAEFERGDRITRINSRPVRGSYDVETAHGYVTLEALNVRTGQAEWISVYLP